MDDATLSTVAHHQSSNHILGIELDSLKVAFRAGGEKTFYERLKGALIQRKWLLQSAPPIPDPVSQSVNGYTMNSKDILSKPFETVQRSSSAGIAGLERRGLDIRKKNEAMIGSAFEDLEGLMASAKEIIALAENFAQNDDSTCGLDANQIIADSAKSLDIVTTKDILGKSAKSEALYLAELSRDIAEYLTDDARGILKKEGGIMTLVDLWAVFNRVRGGVELISPSDFDKAAMLWEKLKLPLRLRTFKNGLVVVQQVDRTDGKTVAQLLDWLQRLHFPIDPMHESTVHDIKTFGRGITAQETAQHFGWSVGVANEELVLAEEKGALCREESAGVVKYWKNWLIEYEDEVGEDIIVDGGELMTEHVDEILEGLKATGLL